MGVNAGLKKLDIEIQMFVKNIEQNLTNIISSLHHLTKSYEELKERIEFIENKFNN